MENKPTILKEKENGTFNEWFDNKLSELVPEVMDNLDPVYSKVTSEQLEEECLNSQFEEKLAFGYNPWEEIEE